MANMYLRVPHYVASYFRNKNELAPIQVGGVLCFDGIDAFQHIIATQLHPNRSNTIVRYGCFCEQQWKMMKKGNAIFIREGELKPQMHVLTPIDSETLSDREVMLLSGNTYFRGRDFGEYLCIRLPKEVFIKGTLYKVTGLWQLLNSGANQLIKLMNDEFWYAFVSYIRKDNEWCESNKVHRSTLEQIERFMTRYNIRNSPDEVEKKTLKRNYYRKIKKIGFSEEDYIEHGV